jgi:hypothetical protein
MTNRENIDILQELEILENTNNTQSINTDNIFSNEEQIKTIQIEDILEEKKYETIEFIFKTKAKKKQNSIIS